MSASSSCIERMTVTPLSRIAGPALSSMLSSVSWGA